MPRTNVRRHTREGRPVRSHTRRVEFKFRPSRAWRNARRATRHWGKERYVRATLFGTAAVAEVLGYATAKSVGGVLVILGAFLAVAGYGLRARAS